METHAHHLHRAPGKKFWHYFSELIMLFFAVFCGFLGENFREHNIERQREQRYIKNLCEDLKSDTAIYSEYNKNTLELMGIVDSITILMKSSGRNKSLSRIYFLARIATIRDPSISPNDRTFDQMKSSGLLRLISSNQVSDRVSIYYNSLKSIILQNDFISARLGDYMAAVGKVFNADLLFKILKDRAKPTSFKGKLLSEDPLVINQFLTSAQYLYGARWLQKDWCMERYERAANLIGLIKKQYHLE